MFAADPRLLNRLEPHLRRVLIIDPNPAAARLLADQMRALGARDLVFEPDERRALELADATDPQVIFVERSGPKLDGESFTRRLRRGELTCRKAPVIMVTADATASTIKGARDCGVHEFMRKPFTAADLIRRVEAVALKPRDWVEAVHYVGPDRRRFNSAEYAGQRKRRSDSSKSTNSEAEIRARAVDQAVRILRSAIDSFDTDPRQARRAIAEQTNFLKRTAVETGAAGLAVAVAALEIAVSDPSAGKAALFAPAKGVLDHFEANTPVKAA